jgi:putative Holliday junction resolvase
LCHLRAGSNLDGGQEYRPYLSESKSYKEDLKLQAEPGRILAIDPGERRLGVAISDPTQTIASPLVVLKSLSMREDAQAILDIAIEQGAVLIIVGQPLHWDGTESLQAEGSKKLVELLQELGSIPVNLADEYGTTQAARSTRLKMNVRRDKRSGHLDDLAATILLQHYLESHDLGEQG